MYKSTLVLGGGIAGIQASLDLAEMGVEVFLVERNPSIGGRMTQLDKTFPTNDCAMCILSPKLVETGAHPYIHIFTNSELQSLEGEPPDFIATILKKPRYVNEQKCTGCGVCMTKCPVKIVDDYNKGLTKTKCIRIPFPQAVPSIPIMDWDNCIYHQRGRCRICEKSCEMGAIDFNQKEDVMKVNIGSVILTPGSDEFNSTFKDEYGYKTFPNVVTSIEFERLLSASGPTQGHILRPSDGKEPQRIAFIQCVGSRDMQIGNEYCSAICCMQAAKDAVIVKEHLPHVESSIFYMDIRAYGKDFDRFIDRSKKDYYTRFIHGRISSIEFNPETENLILQYNTDEGKIKREEFELIVLSIGLLSTDGIKKLSKRLNIELNEHGFVKLSPFSPISTSRSGVFVAGTFSGPKDIPETVMEASGSVTGASSLLVDLPVKEIKEELPQEVNISGEPPRIGVFICRCGVNIASTVEVPEVVEYASGLDFVVHSQEFIFACSQDAQKTISEKIKEKNINRAIVAACTPRTHEPLFQKTLRYSGLNPYLFEFANIREQCSWVHQKEQEIATDKAKDLIRMAVAKVKLYEPLSKTTIQINKRALVIGGGVAGMTASVDLAGQGFEVYLVEKEPDLGGNLKRIRHVLSGEETSPFLNTLVANLTNNEKITVFTNARIKEINGYVGNFKTLISSGGTEKEIEHGTIIVATGGKEYTPVEYLYGKDSRVVTQLELEKEISTNNHRLSTVSPVVMIQCIGSRDKERPYCSRVCCSQAIKNALRLKEINRKVNIYILYRDIRTYGLKELYYKKAREKGIIFVRYEEESKPKVELTTSNELQVTIFDTVLQRNLVINTGVLVLTSGIVANEDNKILSQMLKVPLNADSFFLEAHVKLRPVDFATDGIYVCGLAHYPKDISETITQAKAAAAKAIVLLRKTQFETEVKISYIRKERCTGCGLCVEVCTYKAIQIDEIEKIAVINEALCKGCGVCSASCRSGAVDLKGFKDEHILEVLEAVAG